MKKLIIIVIIFTYGISHTQVAIGHTNPNGNALLDLGDPAGTKGGLLLPRVALLQTTDFSPLTEHVRGMFVYCTNTSLDVTPGLYYNDGTKWIRIQEDYTSNLFELVTNVVISSITYSDIPGMSYTFTAKSTEVIVELNGSGNGTVGAAGNVHFKIVDTNGATICATKTKIQNLTLAFDPITNNYFTWSTTTWNIIAKGKMKNLVIGNNYTIKVQGKISNAYGTSSASINAFTNPEENLIIEIKK